MNLHGMTHMAFSKKELAERNSKLSITSPHSRADCWSGFMTDRWLSSPMSCLHTSVKGNTKSSWLGHGNRLSADCEDSQVFKAADR